MLRVRSFVMPVPGREHPQQPGESSEEPWIHCWDQFCGPELGSFCAITTRGSRAAGDLRAQREGSALKTPCKSVHWSGARSSIVPAEERLMTHCWYKTGK